jgi:hypothetical protein
VCQWINSQVGLLPVSLASKRFDFKREAVSSNKKVAGLTDSTIAVY